jgi:hypothetical protein
MFTFSGCIHPFIRTWKGKYENTSRGEQYDGQFMSAKQRLVQTVTIVLNM